MLQTIKFYGALISGGLGAQAVGLLIFLIAVLGVLGEILAIAALATKSATPIPGQQPGDMTVQDIVVSSVVFLTIIVAATSALVLTKFLDGLRREWRDLRRQRKAANDAAFGDVWHERRPDANTFPFAWQPDAPDDGGFSDAVFTVHGHAFVYVNPQADKTVQEAFPDIAVGAPVTVTDSKGRKIGTSTLTVSRDPRQAAAQLEKATPVDGPAATPKPTASELAVSGAVYDFTITIPWMLSYGITVGQQRTDHFTVAAMMGGPLPVFTL